jgi:hypothetical protein
MARVSKEVAREHERKAWDLRQQGWTHGRIAAEVGLERSSVTKILARLSDRYLKQFQEDVGRVKAEQTAQLEHLYFEAVSAWERSQGTARPSAGRPPPAPARAGPARSA